jgi:ankyrin repeat protein
MFVDNPDTRIPPLRLALLAQWNIPDHLDEMNGAVDVISAGVLNGLVLVTKTVRYRSTYRSLSLWCFSRYSSPGRAGYGCCRGDHSASIVGCSPESLSVRDQNGMLPLHLLACSFSSTPLDIVRILVEHASESVLVTRPLDGAYPLHVALEDGAASAVVEFLLPCFETAGARSRCM